MHRKLSAILVLLFAFLALPPQVLAKQADAAAASAFPLRPRYIDVPILETEALDKSFQDVVIVDVRSQYEYDTLHIQGALLLPLTDRDFVSQVRKLREKSDKKLVFYCNGKTCAKSYDAVIMTQSARIPNTYAYDAGVFDWAKAHPERTVLLGRNPIKTSDLIEGDRFKERLLSPKDFAAKVEAGGMVLDVRDRVQRDSPLFPFKELRAQLDETARLEAIIEQAKKENKPLLVYDAVGKQVQWVQYRLEAQGLKNYYFMKGGAQAYWDSTIGKVTLGTGKAEK